MYGFDKNVPFSQRIKYLRQQAGMTQQEFADYLGFKIRMLQGWEQGKRQPPQGIEELVQRVLIAENVIPAPGPLEKITPEK